MAPSEFDDGEVYWAAPIGGVTPPELSTGNEDDDEILRQIAARTSLELPRSWEHFLLVPGEAAARSVAEALAALGWEVSIGTPGPDDEDELDADPGDDPGAGQNWSVVAGQQSVVLTPGAGPGHQGAVRGAGRPGAGLQLRRLAGQHRLRRDLRGHDGRGGRIRGLTGRAVLRSRAAGAGRGPGRRASPRAGPRRPG